MTAASSRSLGHGLDRPQDIAGDFGEQIRCSAQRRNLVRVFPHPDPFTTPSVGTSCRPFPPAPRSPADVR